jgi:hypothetical protein
MTDLVSSFIFGLGGNLRLFMGNVNGLWFTMGNESGLDDTGLFGL